MFLKLVAAELLWLGKLWGYGRHVPARKSLNAMTIQQFPQCVKHQRAGARTA
jgi:hypothetical protein